MNNKIHFDSNEILLTTYLISLMIYNEYLSIRTTLFCKHNIFYIVDNFELIQSMYML
jgi:hypothetical protein